MKANKHTNVGGKELWARLELRDSDYVDWKYFLTQFQYIDKKILLSIHGYTFHWIDAASSANNHDVSSCQVPDRKRLFILPKNGNVYMTTSPSRWQLDSLDSNIWLRKRVPSLESLVHRSWVECRSIFTCIAIMQRG